MITHYFCGGGQKPHTVQTNTKLLTFVLEKVYTDDYISLSQIEEQNEYTKSEARGR